MTSYWVDLLRAQSAFRIVRTSQSDLMEQAAGGGKTEDDSPAQDGAGHAQPGARSEQHHRAPAA